MARKEIWLYTAFIRERIYRHKGFKGRLWGMGELKWRIVAGTAQIWHGKGVMSIRSSHAQTMHCYALYGHSRPIPASGQWGYCRALLW